MDGGAKERGLNNVSLDSGKIIQKESVSMPGIIQLKGMNLLRADSLLKISLQS